MSEIWNGFRDLFIQALELLHRLLSFLGDDPAWGWAIVALTVVVRVLLLPLAIKQTRSMRAMQALQPQIKAIQKKYKVDRELLRKDPEQYKAKRAKMNEEMTALYQESGVNPASGCLPLIAQAPIFIALFSVLRTPVSETTAGTTLYNLLHADFYFFTPDVTGLSTGARDAGWAGWLLIVLMAASMFYSQRQMMARSAAQADPAQLQQQRIMMIVMPLFLAFISIGFPMGVLLYWVTTNIWQIGQQAVILYEVEHETSGGDGGGSSAAPTNPTADGSGGAGSKPKGTAKPKGSNKPSSGKSPKQKPSTNGSGTPRKSDHLPRRRSK